MKLSKLIPTITSLGVAMTATPIVLSSCSCTNNLRDVNIKDGYNPGTAQSARHFTTFEEMNREYVKLSSKDKAKDYIWEMAECIKIANQSSGPTTIPFTIKRLDSAQVTMESWISSLQSYTNEDGTKKDYIDTSFQFTVNVSGISGRSASEYIPEDSEINYNLTYELSHVPYTFAYGDYKYYGKTISLVPANLWLLRHTTNWHSSAQMVASYKKKYSDKETVVKVDTLSAYWNYENIYDKSKEEEYQKKFYAYPIIYRHLFYKSFFFQNHTCDEAK